MSHFKYLSPLRSHKMAIYAFHKAGVVCVWVVVM